MNSPQDALHVNSVGLLFLLSLSVAIVIAGVILIRTRLWNGKKRRDGEKSPSRTAAAGKYLLVFGTILAAVSLLFFIFNMNGFFL